MWSYLRRFSRMTKEMHPSHRIDILTDAIIYYCQKRIYRDKAKLDKAKESIHSFIHTINDLERWEKVEYDQLSSNSIATRDNISESWQAKYLKLLNAYEEISAFFTNNQCDSITTQLCHHLRRCENKLKAMEQSNNIIQRWTKTCPQYQEVKVLLTSQKRTCLLLKMEQVARERWFLLTLKAKYADGLAIASRLSERISTVAKQCYVSSMKGYLQKVKCHGMLPQIYIVIHTKPVLHQQPLI